MTALNFADLSEDEEDQIEDDIGTALCNAVLHVSEKHLLTQSSVITAMVETLATYLAEEAPHETICYLRSLADRIDADTAAQATDLAATRASLQVHADVCATRVDQAIEALLAALQKAKADPDTDDTSAKELLN